MSLRMVPTEATVAATRRRSHTSPRECCAAGLFSDSRDPRSSNLATRVPATVTASPACGAHRRFHPTAPPLKSTGTRDRVPTDFTCPHVLAASLLLGFCICRLEPSSVLRN